MKRAIHTFKPAMRSLGQAGDQLNKNGAPSLILRYLRQAAKAYVVLNFHPGAGPLVDITFDAIDQAVDTHAEEANAILNKALNKAYVDILRVVKEGGYEHRMGSAFDILAITRNLLKDMKELGIEVEIKKHASTISTAATSALEKLEIEKHAATIGTAVTSALDEVKKLEIEKRAATIGTAVTSALDGVKKLEKHPTVASALDEIKSRGPAAQESLSKISKKVATIIKSPSK